MFCKILKDIDRLPELRNKYSFTTDSFAGPRHRFEEITELTETADVISCLSTGLHPRLSRWRLSRIARSASEGRCARSTSSGAPVPDDEVSLEGRDPDEHDGDCVG